MYNIKRKIIKFLKEVADSKSKTFFFLCVAFILGIGIASVIINTQNFAFYLFCIAVFFIVLLFNFWKDKKIRFAIFCGFFLFLGIFRYVSVLPSNTESEVEFYNGRTVNLIGVVGAEPDIREGHIKLTINSEHLTTNRETKKVSGKVLIKIPKYPEYQYGDKLSMVCNLQTPPVFEDFDYEKYLSRDRIYSICSYPKSIQVLKSNEGNFIVAGIFGIKQKFAGTLNQIFPEPHASFLGGLLYGERRGIPPEIKEEFRKTGVTHIIAISGYNITIVIGIFFSFLMYLWIPKKFAFWVTLVGILFFTILTGAEASVVRAAIMGFVVLSAKQIGRPNQATNALVFSAVLML
ncbi:MAG: ComEC/Rec2 family competence protein, partial [Parcubacteria group bacterium]|nr:ComEC/Rec2 family competence protein [Parcubacteria group bacterium]